MVESAVVKSRDWKVSVNRAKLQEKRFDWISAIKFYEKALATALNENLDFEVAEICERIGFCFNRVAFQAGNTSEFRSHMFQALDRYKEAIKILEKIAGHEKQAKICHCKATTAYVNSFLKSDYTSRKKLLDECWSLEKEALRIYKKADDQVSLGRTYNELNKYLVDRLTLEWNKQTRQKILRKALSYGEKAINIFIELEDEPELIKAYYTTTIHYTHAAKGLKLDDRDKYRKKALEYSQKAVELSEGIGDPYLIGMSNIYQGSALADFTDQPDVAERHFIKALQYGLQTGDKFLVGRASYLLAFLMAWKIVAEEDPEEKRETAKIYDKYAEDAIHCFKIISSDREVASSYYWHAEYNNFLARSEASWKKKRQFLKKSVEAGKKGLKHAKRSGSIDATWFILHPLSKSLFLLSTLETNIDRKTQLLKTALKYREENIRTLKQAMPYFFWNHGVYHNYLALTQAELAKTKQDDRQKVMLLKNAITSGENCIKFCSRLGSLSRGQYAILGKYYFDYGGVLNQLYLLTGAPELLNKLLEVFNGAVEVYNKGDLSSRVAEGYWQLAEVHNKLRNFEKAAESFELASKTYAQTSKKIPSLADFYQNHAYYMKAWSEIAKARHFHAMQQYDDAKKHYEAAASMHKSTKSWKYLVSNYLALAQVEHGETLSRGEQPEEARDTFRKAAMLFMDAKVSIMTHLDSIETKEEIQMATELVKALGPRREYCLGRIDLEEGKILDRQGDHAASSIKFGVAAGKFQKSINAMKFEWDRQEIKPIVCLCKAWQMMARAEAEAAPHLYLRASQFFDEAKKHSFNEKTKLLAIGHSSFCKALETGRKFEATREIKLHTVATKYLEGAANYYVRAGFVTASEYVKATQRLYDAHLYAHKAKTEIDPRKKAQYYRMSEKLLKASATSYSKAKKPEKSQDVQRLLENVREERELALSLTEVFNPSTIMSTTTSFSTPTPTFEKAVGLERFEGANVHVDLVLSAEETKVGEDFKMQIHVANVGKEPVLLTSVEDILPEDFELVVKPDHYYREDMDLNLNRKRLDPLKTEQMDLVLRAFNKGKHRIQARINCIDEKGHAIFCTSEPVNLQISEITLPNRITTGSRSLDTLLCGGIPDNYSVVLTSLSCDERDTLIKSFLKCGAKKQQVTVLVTVSARGIETLSKACQSNLYIVFCNPKADSVVDDQSNVFKLNGVENLTNISIAMTSTFRRLDESLEGPRRACIEIISDVLLQHGAVRTRRWLSALIPELKSRGFITLVVMNPHMHPQQDVQAILDLFDGEINILEKEEKDGGGKFLKVKKMYNKKYLDFELPLRRIAHSA